MVKFTVGQIATASTDTDKLICELNRIYARCRELDINETCPYEVQQAVSRLTRLMRELSGVEVTVRG